ncbi:hypothetical protein [Mycobacterium sp. M26]|uniref:hypothetical protein n=1 Tax=Mycobacterium sp. M26 TaxID=1762962 RepID=UPI00073E905D|nr:hypothetical protein [Mycobacterium sp. M26]
MAPETTPWYRTSAATFAAGLLGLGIIAGLVYAVITMSGQWSGDDSETVVPPGTHLPEPPHFAATTTSATSTTYTTVRLSTTDIGLPGEVSSTTGTTTPTDLPVPTSPPPGAVAPTFPGSFPTRVTHPPGTNRTGPRLNETRTLFPQP